MKTREQKGNSPEVLDTIPRPHPCTSGTATPAARSALYVSTSLVLISAVMVAGSGVTAKVGIRNSHSSPVSNLTGTCMFSPMSVRSETSPLDTSTTKVDPGRMVAISFFNLSRSRSAKVCHFLLSAEGHARDSLLGTMHTKGLVLNSTIDGTLTLP